MKTKLFLKQSVLVSVLCMLCCIAFVSCNKEMVDISPDHSIPLHMNKVVIYMQDFIPYKSDTIGTEVILTDKRDGNTYRCIKMADGRWWMGENLKYNITGSTFYDNNSANLEKYGRLYNWLDAKKATPENWSVPSDDDWKKLEIALGMTQTEADKISYRGTDQGTQLKEGGASGMNLLLGGYQSPSDPYFDLGYTGDYWTSTESSYNTRNAWWRSVKSNMTTVFRDAAILKTLRFSVRCILQEREELLYMQTFIPRGDERVGTEVMLTDKRDGITYRCIKMADDRWWMGENLRGRFGTFTEGNPTETYGLFYDQGSNWDYVPEGWDLPTIEEMYALMSSLSPQAHIKIKSDNGWMDNEGDSGNGTNSSGFNLLPCGRYDTLTNSYQYVSISGYWWLAENYKLGMQSYNSTNSLSTYLSRSKRYQYPVRCILKQEKAPVYMQDFTPDRNTAIGTKIMLTDKRDGITYRCIKMADGRWWMGENMKYDITGSTFYDNDSTNLETYGRLYNWENAIDIAPENWSLPSDDDWKNLEIALGMSSSDVNSYLSRNSGSVGSKVKLGGDSGMNLLSGGYAEHIGRYNFGAWEGWYWTSTENENDTLDASVRRICIDRVGVDRVSSYKVYRLSVRYIKNL